MVNLVGQSIIRFVKFEKFNTVTALWSFGRAERALGPPNQLDQDRTFVYIYIFLFCFFLFRKSFKSPGIKKMKADAQESKSEWRTLRKQAIGGGGGGVRCNPPHPTPPSQWRHNQSNHDRPIDRIDCDSIKKRLTLNSDQIKPNWADNEPIKWPINNKTRPPSTANQTAAPNFKKKNNK